MSALAILALAERFDLAALPEADYVHILVEATKLAFVDRGRHLTDPTAMRTTPVELLAPERLARLAGAISRRRALTPEAAAAAVDVLTEPGIAAPRAAAPTPGGDTVAIVT